MWIPTSTPALFRNGCASRHKPGGKRVPQVVKPEPPDFCAFDRGKESRFHRSHRLPRTGIDEDVQAITIRPPALSKQCSDNIVDRNFSAAAAPCFPRSASADAEILAREFYPVFSEADLVNLPNFSIYLKLMIDGRVSEPFSAETAVAPYHGGGHL